MRHRGNVRLCDSTAHCFERWPCPVHGTLRAGTPLDLAAAASTLCALKGVKRAVADAATCCGCGRHVCSCAKPEPARAQPETGQRFKAGDQVRCIDDRGAKGYLQRGETYVVSEGGTSGIELADTVGGWSVDRFELVTPAPEKPAGELPRGWAIDGDTLVHVASGSYVKGAEGLVGYEPALPWMWSRYTGGRFVKSSEPETRRASMIQACAYALGFELDQHAGGHVYRRKGEMPTAHIIYPTPDACAAAALEAHG